MQLTFSRPQGSFSAHRWALLFGHHGLSSRTRTSTLDGVDRLRKVGSAGIPRDQTSANLTSRPVHLAVIGSATVRVAPSIRGRYPPRFHGAAARQRRKLRPDGSYELVTTEGHSFLIVATGPFLTFSQVSHVARWKANRRDSPQTSQGDPFLPYRSN
jgi:hypothetical protein